MFRPSSSSELNAPGGESETGSWPAATQRADLHFVGEKNKNKNKIKGNKKIYFFHTKTECEIKEGIRVVNYPLHLNWTMRDFFLFFLTLALSNLFGYTVKAVVHWLQPPARQPVACLADL